MGTRAPRAFADGAGGRLEGRGETDFFSDFLSIFFLGASFALSLALLSAAAAE